MTQDRNQQTRGAGQSGQQQQQQGSGRQQGSQQGSGIGGQTGGQSGGMRSSQQGGMSGQSQKFAQQIRPHMEVVDNKGQHVGTVDCCEGGRIKPTKSDLSQGQHRYLQLSQVQSVDGGQIRLSGGAQFLS